MTSKMYNHKEHWKNILFQCSLTLQNQTRRVINVTISLTLLSRMKLPLLSNGPVYFRLQGCWVLFFILIQIVIEHPVSEQ